MLECYNKEFAKIFGRQHPPIVHFANCVVKEGVEWKKRLDGANSNVYDLGQGDTRFFSKTYKTSMILKITFIFK